MVKRTDLSERNTTHGLSKINPRLYSIWKGMRARCNTPSASGYKNYGARGIKVCDEWNYYSSFYYWSMDNGYSESLSIDRVDVNDGYSPTNCRWSTRSNQSRNTRITIFVDFDGTNVSLADLADRYEISHNLIRSRYYSGLRGDDLVRPVECNCAVINGKEVPLKDLSLEYKIPYNTLLSRYLNGIRDDKILAKLKKDGK